MISEIVTVYAVLVVAWFVLFPLGVLSRIIARFMD